MIQFASAAVIFPAPDGSVTIAPNTVAADTIAATGGTNSLVTIGTGAVLTGNSPAQNAIIVTADGYRIINSGKLSSSDAEGIFTDFDNLTIFNAFAPTAGGSSFTGGTDGITAKNGLIVVNESFASITGQGVGGVGGSGIFAADGLTVFNDPSANITGAFVGIFAGANAEITNEGSITGGSLVGDSGINLINNAYVLNSGVIIGATGIDLSAGLVGGEIRSNIVGGDAIFGSTGDDIITLNAGSLITGNILGCTGTNTLSFDGGLTTPGGVSNAVRGDVEGFATVTKIGGGVAFIGTPNDVGTGLHVLADVININGGGLYINADIGGDTVPTATINANGAALGGTGTWTSNVNVMKGGISAGAIPINLDAIPENSIGSLLILGNVVHSPGSFIRVDIEPNTTINEGINSDIIEQIGAGFTYDVTRTDIRISPTSLDRVITAGTYTIIDSDEAIIGFDMRGTIGVQFNPNITNTGAFSPTGSGPNYNDSVLTRFFTTAVLRDADTNLDLDIAYGFGTLAGFSANQQSLGAALDALAVEPGLGAAEQSLIAALALSDINSVQAALAAIGPENTFAISNSIINSNYRVHRMIQDHLAASRMRSGGSSTTKEAAKYDAKGGMISPASETSMSSPAMGTFWGSISGDRQDYEGSNGTSDYDGDVGAVTAGFDYRFNPYFMIGGLVDASSAELDTADIDSLRFVIYGTYGPSLGFYSDFLAGYGTHDFDESSNILGSTFRSDTDANSFQALSTVGYAMGSETLKHGPFIGLEYQNLDVDGFSRTGGGVDITVGDYDIESLRGLIGYRVNARSGGFTPYASVAYAHEFQGESDTVNASIAGAPFSARGNDLESAILVTAGTGYDITSNLVLDVGYRGEISVDEGLSSHGASIGLNYSF